MKKIKLLWNRLNNIYNISAVLHYADGTSKTYNYNSKIQPQLQFKILYNKAQFRIINVSIFLNSNLHMIINAKEITYDDTDTTKKKSNSRYNTQKGNISQKGNNKVIILNRKESLSTSQDND